MALSNTAVPKYYGIFRDAVLKGEIPVCKEIEQEMNRIDTLIANKGVYYDSSKVEGFIKFCENEMVLTNGAPVKMLLTFKLWAEQIFGWYYYVERSVYVKYQDRPGGHYIKKKFLKRLINKLYLIVSRGASKTLFMSFLHAYYIAMKRETTKQIITAPTIRQADDTMSGIRNALTIAPGPLFKMLTYGNKSNTKGSDADKAKLASTNKGIENFITGSIISIYPMKVDRLQGARCQLATVDEWLSGDVKEDPIEAIEQGCSKEQGGADVDNDYLIVAVSSEGTIRNGVGDSIKMDLKKILNGEYPAPHTSIFYYKLDDIKEINDPTMWYKAQPNLGQTVSMETYQNAVITMQNDPSKTNDILAKRFGIPVEGFTYFFTYEDTIPTKRKVEFWKMPCSMGIDLSRGDDFCAFTFLFPLKDSHFGIKTKCYISSYTFEKLPAAKREKYQHFINQGSLDVLDCRYLDPNEIYDNIEDHIVLNKYDVRCVGYDPYAAKEFIERWTKENDPNARYTVCVRQGRKTESVPLGEIKNLIQQRCFDFDEELVSFGLGNCVVIEDVNGNKQLSKEKRENKIDPISALMDAWVSFKLNKDEF